MTLTCGIDAGSRTVKIVLLDADAPCVLAAAVVDQGVRQEEIARRLYGGLLDETGAAPSQVVRCIATGYGRNLVSFADKTITEITCHAVGVHHVWPEARTVVD
ncbi:MAG: 2-hydroxyglutaryl-CoA dehydratase, partial [Planctomycetes bacterium]|nr:2-hydroxyglutaryl-CoA dehydratase [Planctomycetota bacterium]